MDISKRYILLLFAMIFCTACEEDTLFYYEDPANVSRLNDMISAGELDKYLDRTQ